MRCFGENAQWMDDVVFRYSSHKNANVQPSSPSRASKVDALLSTFASQILWQCNIIWSLQTPMNPVCIPSPWLGMIILEWKPFFLETCNVWFQRHFGGSNTYKASSRYMREIYMAIFNTFEHANDNYIYIYVCVWYLYHFIRITSLVAGQSYDCIGG